MLSLVSKERETEIERERERDFFKLERERGSRLHETSLTNATTFQTRLIGRLAASVNRAKTSVTRPLYTSKL